MFCKSYMRAGTKNGKLMVIADIITKTAPATMPITTEDIDNVGSDMVLAPGSTFMVTNPLKVYFMNDEYTWDEV